MYIKYSSYKITYSLEELPMGFHIACVHLWYLHGSLAIVCTTVNSFTLFFSLYSNGNSKFYFFFFLQLWSKFSVYACSVQMFFILHFLNHFFSILSTHVTGYKIIFGFMFCPSVLFINVNAAMCFNRMKEMLMGISLSFKPCVSLH